MSGSLPDWLTDPSLAPVWARVRDRLEARGLDPSGRVRVELPERAQRHALSGVLGRAVTSSSVTLDLAALDARLRQRSGVGGLVAVLTALGGAPPRDRVAERARRRAGRERPLDLARDLVDAPWAERWAEEWVAGLRRTGLLSHRPGAEQVVRDAARVLRQLTDDAPPTASSRVELAGRLLGDAHALDDDRLLAQVVLRGLAAAAGSAAPASTAERLALWERYAVAPDLLSRTCLAWGLRPAGPEPPAVRLRDAADAGDPVHVTAWDLRRLGGFGDLPHVAVLVCENPRVLEAIAERGAAAPPVVCTAGEPSTVVTEVLGRLATAGAALRYHGDFDWAGVGIANRLVRRSGVAPWLMTPRDYLAGVRPEAPALTGTPVEPEWDPELGAAMRASGRAVHEEAVVEAVVEAWVAGGV